MKKPPCADCKRYKHYKSHYLMEEPPYHLCVTNKRNRITGNKITHACWWYRCTPFCKFEQKNEQQISKHGMRKRPFSIYVGIMENNDSRLFKLIQQYNKYIRKSDEGN